MRKVEFIDLSLRDGQQSLFATRMTTPQALEVLPDILDANFPELELWGGATLDAPLRFLEENPWDRLDAYSKLCKHRSKIRILTRGQNLFAYSPYPDNLVIAFTRAAIGSGVNVLRMFDALNDRRNLMIPLLAAKAYGANSECCICYTTSPIHTPDLFSELAIDLENMGADIIAIKDMAGIMHPRDASNLIRSIKSKTSLPLTIHSHSTCGYAETNIIVSLLEGADRFDTAIGPFAGGTSHPPIEIAATIADMLGVEHSIDLKAVSKAAVKLMKIRKELSSYDKNFDSLPELIEYPLPPSKKEFIEKAITAVKSDDFERAIELMRSLMQSYGYSEPDIAQLGSQVPGGMLSNLRNQLKTIGRLESLPAILEEVERVRSDAGFPPLVTPSSQIIGAQAAFNVETGSRYKVASKEFKELIQGKYGKPGPIDEGFIRDVTKSSTRYTQRSGHYVDASPLTVEDGLNPPDFIHDHRSLLLYLMLPGPSKEFFSKGEGTKEIH